MIGSQRRTGRNMRSRKRRWKGKERSHLKQFESEQDSLHFFLLALKSRRVKDRRDSSFTFRSFHEFCLPFLHCPLRLLTHFRVLLSAATFFLFFICKNSEENFCLFLKIRRGTQEKFLSSRRSHSHLSFFSLSLLGVTR